MWVEPASHQSYRDLACKMAGPTPDTVIRGNNRKRRNANARAHRKKVACARPSEPVSGKPGNPSGREAQDFPGCAELRHPYSLGSGDAPLASFFRAGHVWLLKALVYLAFQHFLS